MTGLEAAILEKAHLLCFCLEVGRLAVAKFPDTGVTGTFEPVRRRVFQRRLYGRVVDTALPKIQANSNRTFALIDARLNKTFGKTLVALQPFRREILDGPLGNGAIIALVGELPDQLQLSVFATRQEVHRLFASRGRIKKAIYTRVGE